MSKTISIPLTDGENDYTVVFNVNGAEIYKNQKVVAEVNLESIAALIVNNCVYDEL